MNINTDTTEVTLDISHERCPITFVKTKLLLETMKSGEQATLRVAKGEATDNLPKSLAQLHHQVISLTPETQDASVYLLTFRKR